LKRRQRKQADKQARASRRYKQARGKPRQETSKQASKQEASRQMASRQRTNSVQVEQSEAVDKGKQAGR
jgi:hypothetical protein